MFVLRHTQRRFPDIWSNSLRLLSSNKRQYQEIAIKVPWGYIRGKWWEPYDVRPVLTHHGWQDNCGSFNRLIPLLNKDVGFLTIDFPGHGYSTRIAPGMFYSFMLYVLTIRCVKDYFNWSKISLMGHSLGGITSYIFTNIYPEEVDFLICIDGAKPLVPIGKNVIIAKAMKQFLKENSFLANPNEPPSYTIEEITKKICAPNKNSVLPNVAHHIIERKVAPSKLYPGKYYFTTDPRLRSNDISSFSQNELIEFAQYMTPPIFMSKSKSGSYYEVKENFYQVLDVLKRTSADCDFHYVEGTHHTHLNNPENVAELLVNFIRRHNVEDRSIGGIRDEIIIDKPKINLAELRV